MKLETAEQTLSTNATEADIRAVFTGDQGRGEFIILSQAEQVYIQAIGEDDGPFTVEYRDGGDDRHFQCPRDVSKAEAEAVFLKYLTGDTGWRTDLQWQPLAKKPWWKFW